MSEIKMPKASDVISEVIARGGLIDTENGIIRDTQLVSKESLLKAPVKLGEMEITSSIALGIDFPTIKNNILSMLKPLPTEELRYLKRMENTNKLYTKLKQLGRLNKKSKLREEAKNRNKRQSIRAYNKAMAKVNRNPLLYI